MLVNMVIMLVNMLMVNYHIVMNYIFFTIGIINFHRSITIHLSTLMHGNE